MTKRTATGYAMLLSIIAFLLLCAHRISIAVPTLRQQVFWLRSQAMHDFACEKVSIVLDARQGQLQTLEYEFSTQKLSVRVSENRHRMNLRYKIERFVVARAPSGYSFNEAWKRAAKGERIPQIWLAKELDEARNVVSEFQVFGEHDLGYKYGPLLLSHRFALAIDHDFVYFMDLASTDKTTKTYPFPCTAKTILGLVQIGSNRFGRVRKAGNECQLDLFEFNTDGDVSRTKTWTFGVKKPFVAPGEAYKTLGTIHCYHDNVFSTSATSNAIEVRTGSGELISRFSVPGLDLASGNWDWHGNFICWEEKKGELSYFDIETRVPLKLPTSVFNVSVDKLAITVGKNDLMLIPGFVDAATLAPQIFIASRATGQIVGHWPQRPNRSYSLIENGDNSQILETGYDWGLSLGKYNILDGTIVESHHPLRPWLVWIVFIAIAFVSWSIAWLFYSARNGGVTWMDIALVSAVLLGVALWRLYSSGNPSSVWRLPYEYGGGFFAGLMAIACMQLANTKKNIFNATPICVVFAMGHLLIANLLFAKIPQTTSNGMKAISHSPDAQP